jgi:O-acetyl-ADP-ribose deacetylase (regulator of RNase III)
MKNFYVNIKTGNITHQNVDLIVNSANNYMLMGSGTAEQIREAGGYLSIDDQDYQNLVSKAKHPLDKVLEYIGTVRPIPSKIQKECLEEIIERRNSKPLDLGEAFLTSSHDLAKIEGRAKHIAHAITMGYQWEVQPNPPIIKATHETVRNSLIRSFNIANRLKCKKVAAPILCTRKGGLSIEESSNAMMEALKVLDMMGGYVNQVNIVLYNENLERQKKFFEDFFSI